MLAVTRPSQSTYEAIASSPAASIIKACWWIFISALPNTLLLQVLDRQKESPATALALIMSAFLAALANVAGFFMLVGPLHLIAWLFGGRASFVQVAYTLAAIISPLTLCTALVILPALIPGIGSLGAFTLVFLLLGCQLVLTMIAVNAIHRIGWVWAALAVLVPALFIGIATFLVIFAPLLGELLGIW